MKKLFLLSSAAIIVSAGAAMAADLFEPVAPVAPVVVEEAFSWTGGYLGVSGGYAWGNGDGSELRIGRTGGELGALLEAEPELGVVNPEGEIGDSDDFDAPFAGVQAGFNYQTGIFVLGIEGDVQKAFGDNDDDDDNDDDGEELFSGAISFFEESSSDNCDTEVGPGRCEVSRDTDVSGMGDESLEWWGTARLRAGVAVDRVLLYGTAGLALGETDHHGDIEGTDRVTVDITNAAGGKAALETREEVDIDFDGDDDDGLSLGYALGGGAEFAVTNRFSIKAEYQYINLGGDDTEQGEGTRRLVSELEIEGEERTRNVLATGRFDAEREESNFDFHTLRLGANFRF